MMHKLLAVQGDESHRRAHTNHSAPVHALRYPCSSQTSVSVSMSFVRRVPAGDRVAVSLSLFDADSGPRDVGRRHRVVLVAKTAQLTKS